MKPPIHIAFLLAAAPALATEVDLELVLGVDTSRSMDFEELLLQREGYAAALEHPAVMSAIQSGPTGRIALLYFDWGGAGRHDVILPWTILETEADMREAAETLRLANVQNLRGTGISGAIDNGIRFIEENDIQGLRRVIDISGDGPNNSGDPVTDARERALRAGIEVNGLPIMIKEPGGYYNIPDLDIYYADCVIAGPTAFVMPVYDPDYLTGAIIQKLVLEIAGRIGEPDFHVFRTAGTDCLIGEKLRRRRELDDR